MGAYEERALTAPQHDTWPLVIRMETISDKGRAESHSLQARAHARTNPLPANLTGNKPLPTLLHAVQSDAHHEACACRTAIVAVGALMALQGN